MQMIVRRPFHQMPVTERRPLRRLLRRLTRRQPLGRLTTTRLSHLRKQLLLSPNPRYTLTMTPILDLNAVEIHHFISTIIFYYLSNNFITLSVKTSRGTISIY